MIFLHKRRVITLSRLTKCPVLRNNFDCMRRCPVRINQQLLVWYWLAERMGFEPMIRG